MISYGSWIVNFLAREAIRNLPKNIGCIRGFIAEFRYGVNASRILAHRIG